MDYLVKATPTRELLDLSAVERDELMAAEREVPGDLVAGGAITWIWRLPDTQTSIAIWNAESAEALEAHPKTLPVFPYHTVEITALAAHPAFPTLLSAASRTGR